MNTLQYHFVATTTPTTAREIVSRYIASQQPATTETESPGVVVISQPAETTPGPDVVEVSAPAETTPAPDVRSRVTVGRKSLYAALQAAKRYRDAIEKPGKSVNTYLAAKSAHAVFLVIDENGLSVISETPGGIFTRILPNENGSQPAAQALRVKLSADDVDSLAKLAGKLKTTDVDIVLAETDVETMSTDDKKERFLLDRVSIELSTPAVCAEFVGYSVPGFPDWQKPVNPLAALSVSAGDFRAACKHVLAATDTACTRYALGAIALTYTGNQLEICGTDSRRLHLATINAETVGDFTVDELFLMPTAQVSGLLEATKSLPDNSDVLFAVCGSDVVAQADGCNLRWRANDLGRFPRYQDVIPATASDVFTLSRADFLECLELCSAGLSADNRAAEFQRLGREMKIVAGINRNRVTTSIDCSTDRETAWLACLDVAYLAEYLKNETSDIVTVYAASAYEPKIQNALKFVGLESNMVCVLMPLAEKR